MSPPSAIQRRAALREAEDKQLREDLLHHLWTEFPLHCVTLGEARARAVVEHIIARASEHGFTTLSSVRGYANLVLYMGSAFDEDPQLPWAAAQLGRGESIAAMLALAVRELSAIAGPSGGDYRRALLRVRARPYDLMSASFGQDGARGIRSWLRFVWEQKCEALGEPGLDALIEDARLRSSAHFTDETRGHFSNEWWLVYASLMLLLGSAFEHDPLQPWAAPALAEAADHPSESASSLHAAATGELERFLTLDRIQRDI